MGADKGHCTKGIGTGSMSNSPLEKEQRVRTGIQRQGEARACEGKRQVADWESFHFVFLLLLCSPPPHLPIIH